MKASGYNWLFQLQLMEPSAPANWGLSLLRFSGALARFDAKLNPLYALVLRSSVLSFNSRGGAIVPPLKSSYNSPGIAHKTDTPSFAKVESYSHTLRRQCR